MAARSGFCRCVGLSTAVKVDLCRPNSRSVHANARKGATLLWEVAFVVVDDDDRYEVEKKKKSRRNIALYSLNRGQSIGYLILSALHDTGLAIAIIPIQFRYGILISSRSVFLAVAVSEMS